MKLFVVYLTNLLILKYLENIYCNGNYYVTQQELEGFIICSFEMTAMSFVTKTNLLWKDWNTAYSSFHFTLVLYTNSHSHKSKSGKSLSSVVSPGLFSLVQEFPSITILVETTHLGFPILLPHPCNSAAIPSRLYYQEQGDQATCHLLCSVYLKSSTQLLSVTSLICSFLGLWELWEERVQLSSALLLTESCSQMSLRQHGCIPAVLQFW